jgi:hypothetical protein
VVHHDSSLPICKNLVQPPCNPQCPKATKANAELMHPKLSSFTLPTAIRMLMTHLDGFLAIPQAGGRALCWRQPLRPASQLAHDVRDAARQHQVPAARHRQQQLQLLRGCCTVSSMPAKVPTTVCTVQLLQPSMVSCRHELP